MTDTPPFPALLDLVADRSAALRAAAADAPDPDAKVPGCPGWTVRDLVTHLGEVQLFWAAVVAAGPSGAPPPDPADGSGPGADLLAWSQDATTRLVGALRAAGPDRGCWTWWAASGAPQTAAAVARHQAGEAGVHARDAQEAAGAAQPLPAAVAVDGLAEFAEVALGSSGPWPHRPARIRFAATDGPAVTVDLTPGGARLATGAGEPVTTVRGPAGDLLLTLYGRTTPAPPAVDGDRAVLADLLAWVPTG